MQRKAPGVALLLFILSAVTGCTSVDVQPVKNSYNVTHICIEENPKVIVSDFVSTLEQVIENHLITTEIYRDRKPDHCEFTLQYTAMRSWDMAPYLSHAEIRLYRDRQRIGYAEYHLRGKGGFSLMKWASVESKLTPVVNELLAQYK